MKSCGTTQRLFPTPVGALHEAPEQPKSQHKQKTAGASYGFAITLLSLRDIFPNGEIFPALRRRGELRSPADYAKIKFANKSK